ncbi:hypothetical protein J437_LFUL008313 [Ladona fulva]|uniref:Non-lysosomal glucosylceramidase n=1 Tax=Ladona fulva TaxID=123851 RepID=A0A8K0P0S6_LADFU|nr:hypothetical protein J437_LFUL008313 [Ladona fulva]
MAADTGDIPKYGWKVKLDHVYPEKRTQNFRPRIRQILKLLPLGIRYFFYYIKTKSGGRQPLMDYMNMLTGVPIGGIGSGTIGRGFKGEFCRYQMLPGLYSYHVVDANQFIVTIRDISGNTLYQQVLSPEKGHQHKLSSWNWNFPGSNAHYCALYPRSWTIYDIAEQGIRLICRQVSPVIPHNYKDTSMPTAVFIWMIENNSKDVKNVSITFTFKSGTGSAEDKSGNCNNAYFEMNDEKVSISGVLIHHNLSGMPCTYAVSAKSKSNAFVSRCLNFDPNGTGKELWDDLFEDGQLNEADKNAKGCEHNCMLYIQANGKETACAVCVSCQSIQPGDRAEVEFALAWDMPKVQFLGKRYTYTRYYTKFFGTEGAGSKLSHFALSNYGKWEEDIEKWQEPILKDKDLPDWYKSAIFNELYFVSDGGTVWFIMDDQDNLSSDDPRIEFGRFGYLEGHEYRMYNTYDVHFYASFALSLLWPKLQAALQRDISDSILREDNTNCKFLFNGKIGHRKEKNTVPHDLGDPADEPFAVINSYPIHDVSEWRDLCSKFVLQAYRDFAVGEKSPSDLKQLEALWPVAKIVINRALDTLDCDGDGLIENGGFPDQTYDSWLLAILQCVIHSDIVAYCGSLWLGALQCMVEMAELFKEVTAIEKYQSTLEKGKEAFERKLWNGKYYNFDSSESARSKTIMSDQLCGHWYLKACGISKEVGYYLTLTFPINYISSFCEWIFTCPIIIVFKPENVRSALETIYEYNVLKFANGTMGAVNGMTPDGHIDIDTVQSEEAWVGVIYGLAALMIHEGMVEEGFKTAEGVYRTVYEKIGMGFETPEALYEEKYYRAIGYMRPLSIWAIQHALEKRKK